MKFEKPQQRLARAMGLVGSGARALWAAARRLGRAWEAAQDRAALRGLSDRSLADIGLTRSQIESLYR